MSWGRERMRQYSEAHSKHMEFRVSAFGSIMLLGGCREDSVMGSATRALRRVWAGYFAVKLGTDKHASQSVACQSAW